MAGAGAVGDEKARPRAKAVVLARGLGTRMRQDDGSADVEAAQAEAAARGVKAMMPIALAAPDAPGAMDTVGTADTADTAASGDVLDSGSRTAVNAARKNASTNARPKTADGRADGAGRPRSRPFLDYVLSALADAGYTDACLVIAPDHDAVRAHYTLDAPPRRLRVSFAVQAEPRGTADALLAAEAFAAADDVLVINGDNYYPVAALRALREVGEPATVLFDPDGLVRDGLIAPDRLRAFAVGDVGADGYLADIIEKPDESTVRAMGGRPPVSMNCWRLPASIFDACRAVQPSPRGELELTQAIRDALRTRGLRLRVLRSDAPVLDLSRRADIATVTARLRDQPVHL